MNATSALWTDLERELDHWERAQSVATFWWRDDDAIVPSPQLDVLFECAAGAPLALAVIPGKVGAPLADDLRPRASVVVLQHGWMHETRSSEQRNEYPACRDPAEVGNEIRRGQTRLKSLFGSQSLPIFVPPWHAFDETLLSVLPANGIEAISSKGARSSRLAAPNLAQVNGHMAPIEWTVPASFGPPDTYLRILTDHLSDRRCGHCDMDEATGVITHHLHQNLESWAFMRGLVQLIRDHPAADWISAANFVSSPFNEPTDV